MNEIVSKFLLAGDKFMHDMHLKQPGFTYNACGPFIENKERIQKFKETGDTAFIYKNELDKACFQHDMAYGDFKDLAKRTASDKALRDKALHIAKSPNYDGYQRGLAFMVYKCFDKNWQVLVLIHMQIMKNQLKNYANQLLKNLKKEQFIQDSKTLSGVLIQLICN